MVPAQGYFEWVLHRADVQISPKIRQILDYIETEYAHRIKLTDVASLVCMHPDYLSKKFKEELGVGFHDYLLWNRIQRASFLLVSSLKSVKEISYEVGFSRPEIFSKVFKRLMGYSPQTYRIHSLSVHGGPYVQIAPGYPHKIRPAHEKTISPSIRPFQTILEIKK